MDCRRFGVIINIIFSFSVFVSRHCAASSSSTANQTFTPSLTVLDSHTWSIDLSAERKFYNYLFKEAHEDSTRVSCNHPTVVDLSNLSLETKTFAKLINALSNCPLEKIKVLAAAQ